MDKNYWKEAYKHLWEETSKKEMLCKKILEDELNINIEIAGLGAGSSEFIEGSAADNKFEKGSADLFIPNLNCFVEVTGPNIPVSKKAAIWIRPDKLNNTYLKIQQDNNSLHLFLHVQKCKEDNETLIRGIFLDEIFFKRGFKKEFKTVFPTIRGKSEKYIEIPFDDTSLLKINEVLQKLKEKKDSI